MAALDKNRSMVWWRWHTSVSHLSSCLSMAVSFWVTSINVCVCFDLPPRECRSLNISRPFGEARWHLGPCHYRWRDMDLPIRPWNEAANWTMEDCQIPTTKQIPSDQIKNQNNVAEDLKLEGLFILSLYQLDKQSAGFTIWKYWKGCVKKLDGNDLKFLLTTNGSCITTMHLFTRHCLWRTFSY
jgi:hypothetical protein